MRGCLGFVLILVLLAAGGLAYLWVTDTDLPLIGESTPVTGDSAGLDLATVAVEPGDSIRSCMERNLTPALLLSLYRDDTTLSDSIIRTCLALDIPQELVGLMDPIIQETSRCASVTAKTLTTEEVLILGQDGDTADKDAVSRRMAEDTLVCVAQSYDIPVG